MAAIAPRSWSPQSQRKLARRSPVKHWECSRTRTGAAGSGAPIKIARCSAPPSRGRNAIRRAFSASVSGTRASATRWSPAAEALRLNTVLASIAARSLRRAKSAASAAPRRTTRAAGRSAASFAKATAARAPPLATSGAGPNPGGSAPSEAPGLARLRITAAGMSGETEIVSAPDNSARGARPRATARRRDPRRRLRDFAQPVQIVFGYELGGDREHTDLIIAYQHRLAAAECSDGLAEAAAGARLRPCD